MITFLYETVRKIKSKNKSCWPFVYKLCKLFVNVFYPVCNRWKKSYGLDENSKIVVSLTTYPARIGKVWITITSLLQQTLKPYKVILWLSQEQFPDKKLPRQLVRLQGRGLEIRFCEDLKPHKKYYYAMQEYPEYYVVTADDDIFYPEKHLEQLWAGHNEYPEAVICHWSHLIAFEETDEFQPYNEWPDNNKMPPSHLTLAVGCNGVLYPPYSLPKEAFDKGKIMEYALYTDDLWLKCMEILNDCRVVNCNETILIYFNVVSTQNKGLWQSNTGKENRNDIVWKEMMRLYPDIKNILLEEKWRG